MLCVFIRRVRSAEENRVLFHVGFCHLSLKLTLIVKYIKLLRAVSLQADTHTSQSGARLQPPRMLNERAVQEQSAARDGRTACLSLAQRVTEQRQRDERSRGHAPNTHTEREDRGRGSRSTPREVGD